jgi:hypothetical protein
MRSLNGVAVIAALVVVAACSGGAGAIGCRAGGVAPATRKAGPRIVLNANSPRPTIDVVDVPADQLALIAGADSHDAWTAILKVAGGIDQPPAVGQYSIDDNVVRFTPMFPLDRGRQYQVTFTAPGATPISATVGLPAEDTTPTTSVVEVYPTADVLPANQLRLYIQFSAPMGSRGALDVVHLVDDAGQEVQEAFLPLDADSWNEDRTQYTLAFDPERPVLSAGKKYTLVVDAAWPDAKGLPLKQKVERTFTVSAPDHTPIDPGTWKVEAPATETSDLIVTFPEPLDHGLLLRALGVSSSAGTPLEGKVIVSNHDMTWTFTPARLWKPGAYHIVANAMLEDLAGNRMKASTEMLIPFVLR